MSPWKKLALAATTALTLLALAVMTGGPAAALRALGQHAALAAATSPVDAQAGGGDATSPALGPVLISIGSDWTLVDKLTLTGSLTVRCGPFLPDPNFSSSANVQISEPAGHTVGHAFGSITPACDGVSHTYVVTASVQDVPFRPSSGSATANAFACGIDPSSFFFVCQSGQADPTQVSIRK